MFNKAVLKRAVPFFLTLTVGLFIASFFVSIAAPNFGVKRNWQKHRQYHQKMERENYRLRVENCRMRKQLAEMERQKEAGDVFDLNEMNLQVPPPPPIPPRAR